MLRSSIFRSIGAGILVLLAGCAGQTALQIQPNALPAPTVTGVANQVDGVAPNRAIGVVFSEAMNPSTINANTFYIQGVAGAVSYDATSRIATLKPNQSLAATTKYTAVVTTGATSLAGAPMAQSYTFSFTTRATVDTSPVVVMSTTPADGATCVDVNTKISVIFSEGVDPSTIDGASFFIGGVSGTVTYDAVNIIAIFTPSAPLQQNTTYNATLTAAIKDLAGNSLRSPVVFSFTTEPCGSGGGGIGAGATYLYVGADFNTDTILGYSVNSATASLTAVPGSPFNEGGVGPNSVVVNKNVVYASATNVVPNSNPPFPANTSTIVEYRADAATGTLSQIGSLVISSSQAAMFLDPTGHNLYVMDANGGIYTLIIHPDGTLTNTGSKLQLTADAVWLAVSPNGQLMYVTVTPTPNQDAVWEVNRDTTSGALTLNRQVSSNQHLFNLEFDASGRYLLSNYNNLISVNSVSYSTGDLTPVAGSPFTIPRSLTESGDFTRTFSLDPSGKFVYALSASGTNFQDEYVTVFSLLQTGMLVPVQTFDTPPGTNPASLDVSQSLVFVVNGDAGPSKPSNINVYRRDAVTGMLSAGGSPVTTQSPIQESAVMQF